MCVAARCFAAADALAIENTLTYEWSTMRPLRVEEQEPLEEHSQRSVSLGSKAKCIPCETREPLMPLWCASNFNQTIGDSLESISETDNIFFGCFDCQLVAPTHDFARLFLGNRIRLHLMFYGCAWVFAAVASSLKRWRFGLKFGNYIRTLSREWYGLELESKWKWWCNNYF